MAEQEELNEGQALAALQHLMVEYRAIAKIHGVLQQYDAAKIALPELEKQKAELQAQVSKLNAAIADSKAEHETNLKNSEAESERLAQKRDAQHKAQLAKLNQMITEADARKTAKLQEAEKAEKDAEERIKAAEEKIKAAETKAAADIKLIERHVSEKEKRLFEVTRALEEFKAEHRL